VNDTWPYPRQERVGTAESQSLVSYYTYIMASRTKRLYIGVSNDIERRVWEHKTGDVPGFTSKYKINRLVYYEDYESILDAIEREKQLKGWLRRRKVELIEEENPEWDDLAEGWFTEAELRPD
jgi:putative endonuclease